ncbi:hypothetical protein, partial [Ralstonia pseudosolanacearum]|uniref:hypothetical protein n=1 Tax=Ralstonia pseudosolanacearum TaxID=1310165 RepID=UPI003CEDE4BB
MELALSGDLLPLGRDRNPVRQVEVFTYFGFLVKILVFVVVLWFGCLLVAWWLFALVFNSVFILDCTI